MAHNIIYYCIKFLHAFEFWRILRIDQNNKKFVTKFKINSLTNLKLLKIKMQRIRDVNL